MISADVFASPRARRFWAAAGVAVVAAVSWTASARADAPSRPPKLLSAISQYRESIPTASGAAFPGHTAERSVAPLPRAATQALSAHHDSDAGLLEEIAKSSAYGAPQRRIKPPPRRQVEEPSPPPPLPSGVFDSAVDVVGSRSNGSLIGLLAVMGAILLVAGTSALRRARS